MSTIYSYEMRAYKTSMPTGYVYWNVTGSPDLTGAQSGYSPMNLTDIVILSQSTGSTNSWQGHFSNNGSGFLNLATGTESTFFDECATLANLGAFGGGDPLIINGASSFGGVASVGAGSDVLAGTTAALAKSDSPWYFACRMRYSGSGGSDKFWFGLLSLAGNGQDSFQVGLNKGAVMGHDSTKFSLFVTRSSDSSVMYFDSSIAVDTLYHNHEMWYDGTHLKYRVDEGAIVTAMSPNIPVAIYLVAAVWNDPLTSTGSVDKVFVLSGLPSV